MTNPGQVIGVAPEVQFLWAQHAGSARSPSSESIEATFYLDRCAGERAPVPVPQFMREQAEHEPDPRRIIAHIVDFWRGAAPRTAPIFRIIREPGQITPTA
jgi:hypothetical protein